MEPQAARRNGKSVSMSEERGIAVFRAGNRTEGNFVAGLLSGEGIPVTTLPAGGSSNGEVELHVPAAHADAAQTIIRAYEKQMDQQAQSEEAWVCRRCGEENESSFDTCWNCQAEPGHA